jgi:RecA-family ATPase
MVSTALNLMDPSADVEDLIDLVRECEAEIGERVVLIVVDTVARAMGGANENASEDMARLVAAFDRIRDETGAHVLGIHHSGKDSGKGARGHSSLRAAVDTEVEVTADEATKLHTGHITKQRDLPTKGERFAGRFVSVNVGYDQWQGVVTACAVEDAEPAAPTGRSKPKSAAQQAVMGFLAGQTLGVRKRDVVDSLTQQGVAPATAYRAINDLLAIGVVTDTMGLIYMPKS